MTVSVLFLQTINNWYSGSVSVISFFLYKRSIMAMEPHHFLLNSLVTAPHTSFSISLCSFRLSFWPFFCSARCFSSLYPKLLKMLEKWIKTGKSRGQPTWFVVFICSISIFQVGCALDLQHLFDNNILATGLNYPVVAKGEQEIRLQVSATHTSKDIDYFLHVLAMFKN